MNDVLHELARNLSSPLSNLILQILVILVAARACGAVMRRVGQPQVIGEIVAGILLGPSLLQLVAPEVQAFLFAPDSSQPLYFLSQIGILLFMFIVGLELDTRVLRSKARSAFVISQSSIVVPFALGALLAILLYADYGPDDKGVTTFALFMGIAMSITAFPVLARIIQEHGLTRTQLGTLAIVCAAIDDVTAWCLLALVVGLVQSGTVVGAMWTILLATLYTVFMLLVVRRALSRSAGIVPAGPQLPGHVLTLTFIALLLSAWITEVLGIHALFGAFLIGVVMPEDQGFKEKLTARIHDVTTTILLPLFFAFTGLRTQIGLLDDAASWLVCLLVLGVAILGKFGGAAVSARWTGHDWRAACVLGALMNTRGLMQVIVLNVGYDLGILSPKIFTMMVVMAVITTMIAAPVVRLLKPTGAEAGCGPDAVGPAPDGVGPRPARAADRAVTRRDAVGRAPARAPRVLLAVPESDAHVVANTLLEYFLRQRGCPVVNLGACTPAADIAAAARDFAPDAVLISSHNGHAYDDLRALPEAMAAAGAEHVPVYLGGNVSVGADKRLADTTRFRALGIRIVTSFDAIDEILRLPPAAEEGNGDATAR